MPAMLLFSTAAIGIAQAVIPYSRSPLRRLRLMRHSEAERDRVQIAYYQLLTAHETYRALRQIGHQPIGNE